MAHMSTWLIAAAGWGFAYHNAKTQEQRKARIERVNEQLRAFYGPLLASVSATKSAYVAMVRQHSPDGSADAFQACCMRDPAGPEAAAYRMWMEKVLQPLNEKAASIIADHIDLLDAEQRDSGGSTSSSAGVGSGQAKLVPELLQLVAHVSAMRVILHRWRDGEHAPYWSVIPYPDKLLDHIAEGFARLKAEQATLLGVSRPRLPSHSSGNNNNSSSSSGASPSYAAASSAVPRARL